MYKLKVLTVAEYLYLTPFYICTTLHFSAKCCCLLFTTLNALFISIGPALQIKIYIQNISGFYHI